MPATTFVRENAYAKFFFRNTCSVHHKLISFKGIIDPYILLIIISSCLASLSSQSRLCFCQLLSVSRFLMIKLSCHKGSAYILNFYKIWLNSSFSLFGPRMAKYLQPLSQKPRKTGLSSIVSNPATLSSLKALSISITSNAIWSI